MAYLLQYEDKVRYMCTCGSLKSIARMYFCRHCLQLRCGYCVSHEVDSHYCANCLENLPSMEARLKKNMCGHCFDCPSCQHTMSTRAVSVNFPSPDDPNKMVAKKMYYLACGFCRWTSRDASIPDQAVASGGWPERKNPHAARVHSLLEHYNDISMLEKLEKEKKNPPKGSYPYYSDKYGFSMAIARKRAGLPPVPREESQTHRLEIVKASNVVDGLSEDIFTAPVDLSKLTTLPQRLALPAHQPEHVVDLFPAHKPLLVKRSQRCRECEHNVSKPEFNPSSTKFKIQLSAYYHVPEVKIITCEPVLPGKACELILKLCNPTQHLSSVAFIPLPSPEEERAEREREKETRAEAEALIETGDSLSTLIPSLSRQVSLSESARAKNLLVNGDVSLPEVVIQLPPRDDAAEFDDTSDVPTFMDDPKVVAWRKGNKAAIKMLVSPKEGSSGELTVGFQLSYTYVNTMTATLEHKEPQKLQLKSKVFLNVGKIFGALQE